MKSNHTFHSSFHQICLTHLGIKFQHFDLQLKLKEVDVTKNMRHEKEKLHLEKTEI